MAQLLIEKTHDILIAVNESGYDICRESYNLGALYGNAVRGIVLTCKEGPVSKELAIAENPDNLWSSIISIAAYLYSSFKDIHYIYRCLSYLVYNVIFVVILNINRPAYQILLMVEQRTPQIKEYVCSTIPSFVVFYHNIMFLVIVLANL